MLIAGIDPGLSGAVAFLDATTGNVTDCLDMPVHQLQRGGKAKREIDAHSLAAMLGRDCISHAFVELVGVMPGQGVSSVFSFGKSYGVVLGILAGQQIAFTLVSPGHVEEGAGRAGGKGWCQG